MNQAEQQDEKDRAARDAMEGIIVRLELPDSVADELRNLQNQCLEVGISLDLESVSFISKSE